MKNKLHPKVSIVILNYNGLPFLKGCLKTVRSQTYKNIEIIVVDNNSTDGSQRYIRRQSDVVLIENPENYGYARANNIGVKKATGEFVLILNNDTELNPNTIEELVNCYEEKSILSPLQLNLKNKHKSEVLCLGMGVDIFGYPYDIKLNPNKIFYADGAAIFMKKKDFVKIGGFDEKLFIFFEDTDLSWRARLYGYQIKQCITSVVYHYGGGYLEYGENKKKYVTSKFRRYQNEKNAIRNIIKNYSIPLVIPLLLILFPIHLFEILFLIITGNRTVVKCYYDAYLWNIKNIDDTLKFRRNVQSKRLVSDLEILKSMSLFYQKLLALIKYGTPEFK